MQELAIFAKLAKLLSPPLIIVGLALTLLFGVYRLLLTSGLLSPADAKDSGKIIRLLLNHGLTLGLLVVALGFGLLFFESYLGARREELEILGDNPHLAELARHGGRPAENGYRLTLEQVNFASGRADLLPGADPILARLAEALHADPQLHLLIEGHTDARGDRESNQQLSEQRALAVRTALLGRGVDPARLEALGYGESRPRNSTDDPDSRRANRRVELLLYRRP